MQLGKVTYLWGTSVLLRNIDCRLHCCIVGLAYNHRECFTLIGIAAYASNVLLSLVFGVQGLFPSCPLPQAMRLSLPQLRSLLCNALCSLQCPLLSRAQVRGAQCYLCGTAVLSKKIHSCFSTAWWAKRKADFLPHAATFDDIWKPQAK